MPLAMFFLYGALNAKSTLSLALSVVIAFCTIFAALYPAKSLSPEYLLMGPLFALSPPKRRSVKLQTQPLEKTKAVKLSEVTVEVDISEGESEVAGLKTKEVQMLKGAKKI